ncbi:MAG TPA: cupredoxin domain-containing protein [Thermoanaerobaculia bacterium]|nr:cupredoxin domain-containing protein [Thermoanaerobaculia bacterium]
MFAPLLFAAAVAAKKVPDFLPNAAASKIVAVTARGPSRASLVVMTEALATKESGPKETVKAFGEVYAFSPATLAVHRDEPTLITFWNLQSDDEHDFMLIDDRDQVLMKVTLPPLRKASWVFTFRREGVFRFTCTLHLPEMAGQIIVAPPRQ